MHLHDSHDSEGRVLAFEVKNFCCSRQRVCRIARTVPGARIVRQPMFLSSLSEEVFCEFELDGITFVAWEPFGDNDVYWIVPEPARWVPQIDRVREAFSRA